MRRADRHDEEGAAGVLAAVALGRHGERERSQALKGLISCVSPAQLLPTLVELTACADAPADLRSMAAARLGDHDSDDARAALLTALRSPALPVVRRAAESLGRVGGPDAMIELESLYDDPTEAAGRSIGFARSLLSYRLGFGSHRLPAPDSRELVPADCGRTAALSFGALAGPDADAAADAARADLPTVAFAEVATTELRCRQARLAAVLTDAVTGSGAVDRLRARDTVVGVVLKQSTCPGGWYRHAYLLAHTSGESLAQLFVTRGPGTTHFGELALEGCAAQITVTALDTPATPPLTMKAIYREDAMLEILSAQTGLAAGGRRRPAVPQPDQR